MQNLKDDKQDKETLPSASLAIENHMHFAEHDAQKVTPAFTDQHLVSGIHPFHAGRQTASITVLAYQHAVVIYYTIPQADKQGPLQVKMVVVKKDSA